MEPELANVVLSMLEILAQKCVKQIISNCNLIIGD